MYWAFYLIAVFAGLAMMVREGLWSNTITLINILFGGLIAFGFSGPLTTWIDEKLNGQFTYVIDLVVVWVMFWIAMTICRLLTGAASKTRMRFKHPIDSVGGPLVGLVAAWVLATFVMATLHLAPMPANAFGLGDKSGEFAISSPFTAPDHAWLRLVNRASSDDILGASATHNFSAPNYIGNYLDHRGKLEKAGDQAKWLKVNR